MITSAQTCPSDGSSPSPVVRDAQSFYDNGGLGSVNGAGDLTATSTETDAASNHWAQVGYAYDATGRPTRSDVTVGPGNVRTTSTAYTLAAGGQLSQTSVTNPLGQVTSSTVDPARGLVTATVDVAGHRTDSTYDALGRLTAVWQPGQARATDPATETFAYLVRANGPLAVTDKKLVDPGRGVAAGYVTTVTLMDAFGGTRQVQSDAVGGGRVVSDTYLDSHGWTVKTNNHWYTSGAPATTLITTTDSAVDSRTITNFDAAGRVVKSTEYAGTTAKSSTTTIYGGDRVTVIPPTGGVSTTTVTDVRGATTELDRWTTAPTISGNVVSGGAAQRATYTYDALGQLTQMTTAAGTPQAAPGRTATTSWVTQRPRSTRTPALTSYAYDDAGEVASTTDARGQTLAYSYDALGRKVQERSGSSTGRVLAAWTFDTLQAGQPTSSTRYTYDAAGNQVGSYVVGATGYDASGSRPVRSRPCRPVRRASAAR